MTPDTIGIKGLPPFAPVPQSAIQDERVSKHGVAVMTAICSYRNGETGVCWPSLDSIAKRARLARSTVWDSINELVELGHLVANKTPGRATIYEPVYQYLPETRPPGGPHPSVVRTPTRPPGGPEQESSDKKTEQGTRPIHFLLAEDWYRAYTKKTLQMVAPGPEDYLKAQTLCSRMDPKVAESAIAPYFSGDWWFTRDKVTKRVAYSFGGWAAHIEEILAAGPAKSKTARGWECPSCGAQNTHTGQMCMSCHEGREGA